MTETFLILLAGGIMLACAVSSPKQVTLNWLRLGGIIALSLAGLSLFFYFRREPNPESMLMFHRIVLGQVVATIGLILGQLGFVQVASRGMQRLFALLAFLAAVMAGTGLLHDLMLSRGTATLFPPKALSIALQALACAGVAAMTGLVLMDMLLGHAYLTASQMTMRPFARLNNALGLALGVRILLAVGLVLLVHRHRPVNRLWDVHGLFIGTRYFVGLLIPAMFIYMAYDCIKRRATQSATGILYVCGVLVLIGEIVALYLVRETGLPF